MSHDPTAQTLLALELCCRSLAQRILLIRELQKLQFPVPDLGAPPGNPLSSTCLQEIQRHLSELPDLEHRFYEACEEHTRCRAAASATHAPNGVRPNVPHTSLQELISSRQDRAAPTLVDADA